MKKVLASMVITTAIATAVAFGQQPSPVVSVHTSLEQPRCTPLTTHPESAKSVQQCPGAGGYRLLALDSDSRMSITVVAPDGTQHPLDYWYSVTPYLSELGTRAEWRVSGTAPVALIVRVNANEDPSRPTPYFAVAKITATEVCVTDKIRPSSSASEEARKAADGAAARPCLKR